MYKSVDNRASFCPHLVQLPSGLVAEGPVEVSQVAVSAVQGNGSAQVCNGPAVQLGVVLQSSSARQRLKQL